MLVHPTVLAALHPLPAAVLPSAFTPTPVHAAPPAIVRSMRLLLAIYLTSSSLTIGLPDSGARYAPIDFRPAALLRAFGHANRTL